MSYTLARLPVPRAVWDLIADKLRAAGYDHVFHGDTIDMTHIGLEVGPGSEGVTTLGAALTDPRVLRGQRWVSSRIATSIGTASARFEVWQFRVTDGMAETRSYNPDRESSWRPWRPARDFGIEQLRQPATIIEPTDHAP